MRDSWLCQPLLCTFDPAHRDNHFSTVVESDPAVPTVILLNACKYCREYQKTQGWRLSKFTGTNISTSFLFQNLPLGTKRFPGRHSNLVLVLWSPLRYSAFLSGSRMNQSIYQLFKSEYTPKVHIPPFPPEKCIYPPIYPQHLPRRKILFCLIFPF